MGRHPRAGHLNGFVGPNGAGKSTTMRVILGLDAADVPGTVWLLAATIVLTVAVSTAATAATRCPVGTGCPVDTTKLGLTGVQYGQAAVAVLAVLGIGRVPR